MAAEGGGLHALVLHHPDPGLVHEPVALVEEVVEGTEILAVEQQVAALVDLDFPPTPRVRGELLERAKRGAGLAGGGVAISHDLAREAVLVDEDGPDMAVVAQAGAERDP